VGVVGFFPRLAVVCVFWVGAVRRFVLVFLVFFGFFFFFLFHL